MRFLLKRSVSSPAKGQTNKDISDISPAIVPARVMSGSSVRENLATRGYVSWAASPENIAMMMTSMNLTVQIGSLFVVLIILTYVYRHYSIAGHDAEKLTVSMP